MNWRHFKTIVWLRWRIARNQFKRAGSVNAIVFAIFVIGALVASVAAFFSALVAGFQLLPSATSSHFLYTWLVVIAAFLFCWLIGLMTALQRSDVLSFENLLHLPISLSGAFLVNYAASLVALSLIVFLPGMFGLAIASVAAKGAVMLIVFPLLASFTLMVTAVTFQFRGWLAALMVNQKRRRTIIAIATMGFILLAQLPNIFNMTYLRSFGREEQAETRRHFDAMRRIDNEYEHGKLTAEQYRQKTDSLSADYKARETSKTDREVAELNKWATIAALAFPPGWLAYGASAAARNNLWPGLLGTLGLFAIGTASLWRSYRTMVRFYRGDLERGRVARPVVSTAKASGASRSTAGLIEKSILWVPGHASAVAMAGVRSLLRAPEVKMAAVTPLFFFVIFGSTLFMQRSTSLPVEFRPLMTLAAITMTMFGLMQLVHNQFGFDRDGFRAFVLSPVSRRQILLGKNLSLAPLALSIAGLAVVAMQIVFPQQLSDFCASLLQLVSVFLIFCMVGNQTSILVPVTIRAGSLKGAKPTSLVALVHFLAAIVLMVSLTPILIPFGMGYLLSGLSWSRNLPNYLMSSALVLAGVIALYRYILAYQGRLLQRHEQAILATVAAKND